MMGWEYVYILPLRSYYFTLWLASRHEVNGSKDLVVFEAICVSHSVCDTVHQSCLFSHTLTKCELPSLKNILLSWWVKTTLISLKLFQVQYFCFLFGSALNKITYYGNWFKTYVSTVSFWLSAWRGLQCKFLCCSWIHVSPTTAFSTIFLKFHAKHRKVKYLKHTRGKTGVTSSLAPQISTLCLSLRQPGDDVLKTTNDWKGLRVAVKLTVQDRLILKSYLLSFLWSPMPWRRRQEMERSRKTLNTVETSHFDEIVNTARLFSQHHSLARKHSALLKRFWALDSLWATI